MRRNELAELHYIAPIANLPSILAHGILSHNSVKKLKLEHESVAMQEIQDRRERVVVGGSRPLHDYANLYFHARNPMMYLRRDSHARLCVLRVNPDVVDLPDVVLTDGNASSGYARFAPAPEGLSIVDRELTYAEDWTDPNAIVYFRRKSARCAEVLVPERVGPGFIVGIYVSCLESYNIAAASVASSVRRAQITTNSHLFFQGG